MFANNDHYSFLIDTDPLWSDLSYGFFAEWEKREKKNQIDESLITNHKTYILYTICPHDLLSIRLEPLSRFHCMQIEIFKRIRPFVNCWSCEYNLLNILLNDSTLINALSLSLSLLHYFFLIYKKCNYSHLKSVHELAFVSINLKTIKRIKRNKMKKILNCIHFCCCCCCKGRVDFQTL